MRRAVELARAAGCTISLDLASYNVVESNLAFLHDIVEKYVDIVFANETEARAFTGLTDPRASLALLAGLCHTAIVKVGKAGSWVRRGDEEHFVEPWPADPVDATGAGDSFWGAYLFFFPLSLHIFTSKTSPDVSWGCPSQVPGGLS